jgi:transposase
MHWIQKTFKRDMKELPTVEECKVKLRKAQCLLKNVKKQAHDLRIEFLIQTLDEAIAESESHRERAIRNIMQSQEKLQSFARIRQIFKPKSQSGLSRILIPAKIAMKTMDGKP